MDEVEKLLLSHPQIDINKGNDEGKTALYIASASGHNAVVKELEFWQK